MYVPETIAVGRKEHVQSTVARLMRNRMLPPSDKNTRGIGLNPSACRITAASMRASFVPPIVVTVQADDLAGNTN